MCFVQVFFYPLLIHLIGTGVAGKRVHIPCGLLEVFQAFGVVVQKNKLVVHVIAGEQHANGCGK